jgi:hypothetical protein
VDGGTHRARIWAATRRRFANIFSRELQHGVAFVEGMALQVLVARMKEGHAPSARAVLEITRAKAAPRASVIGKKEARKAAAHHAPAEWGDLLGDGGLVN